MSNRITDTAIDFEAFQAMCAVNIKYTGHVKEFGYVYWADKQVPITVPSANGMNRYAQTHHVTVSQMKVIPNLEAKEKKPLIDYGKFDPDMQKEQRTEEEKFNFLAGKLMEGIAAINSSYGVANSFQQLSNKIITIPAQYKQVNPQGTLVKIAERKNTTAGSLAKTMGKRVVGLGLGIDAFLYFSGNQSPEKTLVNVGINLAIFAMGLICAPLGVVLGTAYFLYGLYDALIGIERAGYVDGDYTKLHGSSVPADNTRIVKRLAW